MISYWILIFFLLVLREPPFVVKEEGYAGFEIGIEIYFKGVKESDQARKVSGWPALI